MKKIVLHVIVTNKKKQKVTKKTKKLVKIADILMAVIVPCSALSTFARIIELNL